MIPLGQLVGLPATTTIMFCLNFLSRTSRIVQRRQGTGKEGKLEGKGTGEGDTKDFCRHLCPMY